MDMEVRHFLAAALSAVRKDAIALAVRPGHPRHLADRPYEIADFRVRCLGSEIVPTDIMALGDHQHMDWRQRVDVVESKAVLGLHHGIVWNLAAEDLGEDILVVIGLLGIDRHMGRLSPLDRLAPLATTKSDE